jgi:DNA polymerase-3 subunit alpha
VAPTCCAGRWARRSRGDGQAPRDHRRRRAKKGYDPALAEQLFDLMTKFAEYGFNKSHTAAYAVVTYHTAWLKAHHCAAFMAATLSSDMDNTDTVKIFYDDAIKFNKLTVLGAGRERLRIPLRAGRRARRSATARRGQGHRRAGGQRHPQGRADGGPFKDLFDFCLRVDKRMVNRRTIEALIRAGAFDALDDHRARLLGLGRHRHGSGRAGRAQRHAGQPVRRGRQPPEPSTAAVCEVPRWTERQKLTEEKDGARFLLLRPSVQRQAPRCRSLRPPPLATLEPRKEPQLLAGLVSPCAPRSPRAARWRLCNSTMARRRSKSRCSTKLLRSRARQDPEDEVLIVEGKVQKDDFAGEGKVASSPSAC